MTDVVAYVGTPAPEPAATVSGLADVASAMVTPEAVERALRSWGTPDCGVCELQDAVERAFYDAGYPRQPSEVLPDLAKHVASTLNVWFSQGFNGA